MPALHRHACPAPPCLPCTAMPALHRHACPHPSDAAPAPHIVSSALRPPAPALQVPSLRTTTSCCCCSESSCRAGCRACGMYRASMATWGPSTSPMWGAPQQHHPVTTAPPAAATPPPPSPCMALACWEACEQPVPAAVAGASGVAQQPGQGLQRQRPIPAGVVAAGGAGPLPCHSTLKR